MLNSICLSHEIECFLQVLVSTSGNSKSIIANHFNACVLVLGIHLDFHFDVTFTICLKFEHSNAELV